MDGETIDILAAANNASEEVANITKRSMNGELDFFESLTKRVKFLKGLPLLKVNEICKNLPIMPGAGELIEALKQKGIKVVVFSGGFHNATDVMQRKLNFDANFANILHHKDGILSGEVGGEMMFSSSKGDMIDCLCGLLNLGKDEIMCVGDGANDISMFRKFDLSIAFCAKDILKKEATHCVDVKDLREILKFIR